MASGSQISSKHIDKNHIKKFLKDNKPRVIKNMLKKSWEVPWTLEELEEQCGSIEMHFRVFHIIQPAVASIYSEERLINNDPVWESDGIGVRTTLKNFLQWIRRDIPDSSENPFYIYAPEDYWIYASYAYMHKLPQDSPIVKGVDWSPFGFPEIGGRDSTLWIGSNDSSTPLHMDTYGFNLVAQIIGEKKWILFPPSDSSCMYMSRIPYEESSVFGLVNVVNPDLTKHPLFKFSHPHVVTLEPGDVLFVPKNWWHYVSSKSTSVSINTWIQMDSDDEARLHEAVTQALMSIIIPTCDINPKELNWLNPDQILIKPEDIEKTIKTPLNMYQSSIAACFYESKSNIIEDGDGSHDGGEQKKVLKKDGDQDVHSIAPLDNIEELIVEEMGFKEYFTKHCLQKDEEALLTATTKYKNDPVNLKSIVNCLVHPDVISCISEKLIDLRSSSLYFSSQ